MLIIAACVFEIELVTHKSLSKPTLRKTKKIRKNQRNLIRKNSKKPKKNEHGKITNGVLNDLKRKTPFKDEFIKDRSRKMKQRND
jgi:hypothetical protein